MAAIYVVRHPFDVAVSLKDHFGVQKDEQAVQIMLTNEKKHLSWEAGKRMMSNIGMFKAV